jgi:hypothetical protein
MAILAGEIVSAGRLMRLQTRREFVEASGSLTMTTTTETDIPGAEITLTTATAGALWEVDAIFDGNVLATSTTILMLGKLMVDGVLQSGTATKAMDVLDRVTAAFQWDGTFAAAGSHTLKLRGNLSNVLATGGNWTFQNTRFRVRIYEVV